MTAEIIQSQINDKTSGARMPRINEEIFFNLHFPMPDIQEQLKISQKISSMKTEIELNKEKAKNLRVSAEEEFEKTRTARQTQNAENGGRMQNAAKAPTFESIDLNKDGVILPAEFAKNLAKRLKNK